MSSSFYLPAREWDEVYLRSLPVQEYDDIEFKSSPLFDTSSSDSIKKLDLSIGKGLSALANSGGGFFVFGINDPKKTRGDQLEVVHGGIPRTTKGQDTAEWLRARVPRLVDPVLVGFDIHPIVARTPDSDIDPDKGVYVIEVPDSSSAPHQCRDDHIYYIRAGGNSSPATDRQVRDILGRRVHPSLDICIGVVGKLHEGTVGPGIAFRQRYFLRVGAINSGRVYAKYVNVQLHLPPEFVPNQDIWAEKQITLDGTTICQEELDNTRRDIIAGDGNYAQYGPSWFDPILPGRARSWEVPLNKRYRDEVPTNAVVRWRAYADNAPMTSGEIPVEALPLDAEWAVDGCPCCGTAYSHGSCEMDCELNPFPHRSPVCGSCSRCDSHCQCASRK